MSNSSTNGAAIQQTLEVGGLFIIPFSLGSNESAPRCATQIWFCASVVTAVTEPITHESSRNGRGHSGTTR